MREISIDSKIKALIGRIASLTSGDTSTIEYVTPSKPNLPERYNHCRKMKFTNVILNELEYDNNLMAFILTTSEDAYIFKINDNDLAVQFVKYAIFATVLDSATPMMYSSDDNSNDDEYCNLTSDTISSLYDEKNELYASKQIENIYSSAKAASEADALKEAIDESSTVAGSLKKFQ